MVEVICDTNFLIHLATKRIKNIDNIDVEIGSLTFVVPKVVEGELFNLKSDVKKKQNILDTLDFIKNFKIIPIQGKFADKELIDYVKNNGGIIGTMDKELKKEIKKNGGSIISFSSDKMVLES
ncbi:MAG: twitching motility protein PilT [Nitrosopumilus sp.]|nr:twitching motility protein PilT [Nitrosopumilus sp.]MDH3824563.1 twitching motility protein PilT [Nitrosopumilus sp.]